MPKTTKMFPVAKRPLEYVAFLTLRLSTEEGPGFLFIAVDAFSEFAFLLGVEANDSNETFLKYVYKLTENKDFLQHRDKGFTLVLENREEIEEQILSIIIGINGSVIFDKGFNRYISQPVLKSIGDYMNTSRK